MSFVSVFCLCVCLGDLNIGILQLNINGFIEFQCKTWCFGAMCVYIYFVLPSGFIKQVKVHSAANSCFFSTQTSLLFSATSGGDPCSSMFLPHQSDKSLLLPLSAPVSPATVSNECCFNLRLIAEWHFPLWAPSLLSFFDLSGNSSVSDWSTLSHYSS